MGSRLGSVTAWHSSSGRQPNFAALNRGCHVCSAGRPSRWALAHISSLPVIFTWCGPSTPLRRDIFQGGRDTFKALSMGSNPVPWCSRETPKKAKSRSQSKCWLFAKALPDKKIWTKCEINGSTFWNGCALVANAKWCHMLPTAAHSPRWMVDCSSCTQLMALLPNG